MFYSNGFIINKSLKQTFATQNYIPPGPRSQLQASHSGYQKCWAGKDSWMVSMLRTNEDHDRSVTSAMNMGSKSRNQYTCQHL